MAIKGIIFDFDGLILDTETPVFRAWQEIFNQHGCTLTLAAWADYVGRAPETFDPCHQLEACLGHPVDRDRVKRSQKVRETELIARQPLLPGVQEAIADAKRLGLQLGIASSSSREWVISHLSRFGLVEHFPCIRCSDDVAQTKPAPDLYLSALRGLGLRAQEALALEDSPHGVRAAKEAGILCIAVPNELTRNLPLTHAELILPSLRKLSLEEVITRLNRNHPLQPKPRRAQLEQGVRHN